MKTSKSPLSLYSTLFFAAALSACQPDATSGPATSAVDDSAPPVEETSTKIDHVDAKGAAELLASEDKPVVLDVRTPEEFAEGHIDGATMVDFTSADFESKIAQLDRDQPYLVHCQSGRRSSESLSEFEKLGFKHIIHLDGGFKGWQEAGQPVVK